MDIYSSRLQCYLVQSGYIYFIALLLSSLSRTSATDVEEACPIIQLLDSDREEDSEIEIEWTLVIYIRQWTVHTYLYLIRRHMNFIVSFLLFGLNAMFFCNKRRSWSTKIVINAGAFIRIIAVIVHNESWWCRGFCASCSNLVYCKPWGKI